MNRVTFDTNTFGILNLNDTRIHDDLKNIGSELRAKIARKEIAGYISEASVFIECLGFEEKLTYLSVAGTRGERPSVDPRGIAAISELGNIGFKMLHAPMIMGEIFGEGLPWAEDERYSQTQRLDRFASSCRKHGHPEKTIKKLQSYGNNLLDNQSAAPATWKAWAIALKKAWDDGGDNQKKKIRNAVNPVISEWGDILIISSHHAYGNDVFCTNDRGKGAGNASVLHSSNKSDLRNEGILVMSPKELFESF